MTYLKAIESECLLIRGETGMLANADGVAEFAARKEACGERLRDLVLPGSHHLHVSRRSVYLLCLWNVDRSWKTAE